DEATDHPERPPRTLEAGRRAGPRTRVQHRADGGRRAGLPAGGGRHDRRGGAGPRREPRRALPGGSPAARRRPLAAPLAGVPGAERFGPPRAQGREAGTLRAHGAQVLMVAYNAEGYGPDPDLNEDEPEWWEGPPRK